MRHTRMMWGCVAVIAVVVAVAITGTELPNWARLVVLAACPVMMIAMMSTMGRGFGQDHPEVKAGVMNRGVPPTADGHPLGAVPPVGPSLGSGERS